MDEEYYTPEEVAKRFKVTRNAVYNWIAEGRLRAVKIGRTTRIAKEALDQFVKPVDPATFRKDRDEGILTPVQAPGWTPSLVPALG